jgi:hypothetical protein
MPTPGFVATTFDVPFPVAIPNGAYLCFDPAKEVGVVETTLREGSRVFFRGRPLKGPTSFRELQVAARDRIRPKENRDYVVTSELKSGEQKATLNVNSGEDGGYAECKYYSEVTVTFLADDLDMAKNENHALRRACEVLNPFLDAYRLFNEDYRISSVSPNRNYYFAVSHTSPLTPEESSLSPRDLFKRLKQPREFRTVLGKGAFNSLRLNSFETLGPRSQLQGEALNLFVQFVQSSYQLPLFYDLLLEAVENLQRRQDYRLAVVHAETAFEVYVRESLLKVMAVQGISERDAATTIDDDPDYWGIKKKIRRLDDWTKKHAPNTPNGFVAFQGSALYKKWESDLYDKRNAAIHAGARAFCYAEASAAIAVAKECIVELEKRIPGLADRVQINASMAGFREDAGEVRF